MVEVVERYSSYDSYCLAKVLDCWPDQSKEPPKYLSADHHRAVLDII
jgi:hypothetical protein